MSYFQAGMLDPNSFVMGIMRKIVGGS